MTDEQFRDAAILANVSPTSQGWAAARLVFVQGKSRCAAARELLLSQPAVSQVCTRITKKLELARKATK